MRKSWFLLFTIAILIQMSSVSFSLEKPTHSVINDKIVQSESNGFSFDLFLKNNLGFSDGKITLINGKRAFEWITDGGKTEDEPAYTRSRNHFHNPLLPWGQAGLYKTLDFDLFTGQSSALWIQDQETRRLTDLGGDWSWKKARQFYYAALTGNSSELNGFKVDESFFSSTMITGSTNISQTEREKFFAWTFRAVGQTMHLVEDASVPSHTRNDVHILPEYEFWLEKSQEKNSSIFDAIMSKQPIYFTGPILSIASFIDTNIYTGANLDQMAGTNIGLAEYTNANFFSEDTIFDKSYPFPSRSSVNEVDYDYPDPFNPGTAVKRLYYKKIADGETNGATGYRLAAVDYLRSYRQTNIAEPELSQIEEVVIPPMDDYVYQDYAELLIPRAIGYATGLLNYFFRGALELSIPSATPPTNKRIVLNARNTTPNNELMDKGTIELMVTFRKYKKDGIAASGTLVPDGDFITRRYQLNGCVGTTPCSQDVNLGTGVDTLLDFDLSKDPLPYLARDISLTLVYHGDLGNEKSVGDNGKAVACGMITLEGIGGELKLSLPARGVYASTSNSDITGSFTDFALAARNTSTEPTVPSGQGDTELMVVFRDTTGDPFQNTPFSSSPDTKYVSATISTQNGISTATTTALPYLLASGIPIKASNVSFYLKHTDNSSNITYGYQNISEPTPVDVYNNTDKSCVDGHWYNSGAEAIAAIAAYNSQKGITGTVDAYPHIINNIFYKTGATGTITPNASASYNNLTGLLVQPGSGLRLGYILTDYLLDYTANETVTKTAPLDDCVRTYANVVFPGSGFANAGVNLKSSMYTMRGYKMWWGAGFVYDNKTYPDVSTASVACGWENLP